MTCQGYCHSICSMYARWFLKISRFSLLLLSLLLAASSSAERPEEKARMNTICEADDRNPDEGYPVGRVYYNDRKEAICTAWIAPNGWLVTAGHCNSGYYKFDEIQFQVPESNCSGEVQVPEDRHRYRVDLSSIKSRVDLGATQDWALFQITPHPTFGMPGPFGEGSFFRISNRKLDRQAESVIRNTGFGVELRVFEGCKKRNRTMQSSLGKAYNSPGYLIHFLDTHMGSSGSPLYEEASNALYVMGTHRGGGCPNIATSVLNPGFLKALNDVTGRPTVYVDWMGPRTGPSNGGIEAPFRNLNKALEKVKSGGDINIVPGNYRTANLKIPNRPLRIRAPFGSVSIGQQDANSAGDN